MKKRILIFSTAYFPLVGGAEIAVKEITDRLPDYEFVMVTARIDTKLPLREQCGNVECCRIGSGNFLDKYLLALNGPRFAETLGHFDAVWAIMASYAGFAALRYKKHHPAAPYLLTLQEGDSRWDIYKHVWWCWPYFKQIFTRADRIQAISAYLAAWAKKLGARCPVDVVSNGVDTADFSNRTSDFGPSKMVVSVSRLVKKNGLDALIRAFRYLPDDTSLLLVGGGEEDANLRAISAREGLSDRVRFAGAVSNDKVVSYLAQASVFCRPSRSEGLGTAFLEAMAAGVPVVATPVGGIPDFLRGGETGLFCRTDDPEDIAEKISRIMTDSELAERLRANGLALVKEKYQWDAIARRMGVLFEKLPSNPFRLLLAADIFPPQSGGPATYVVMLANELVRRGIGVRIASLNPESDRSAVSCELLAVRSRPKLLRYIEYLCLLFKEAGRVDVVYAMGPVNAGFPALAVARLRRKKFAVKVVGDYAWEQFERQRVEGGRQRYTDCSIEEFQNLKPGGKIGLLKRAESFVVRRAGAVITPCEYLKKMTIGWGALENRVSVIYNAVEMKTVTPAPKSEDERWIVSAGRLVPWKGMDTLISILPEIQKEFSDVKLKIIGDGSEKEKLKDQSSRLKAGSVESLGNLSHEQTASYIAAADVFVLNSGYEGLSHVLLEALSLGVPVLASRVGGNSEVLPGDCLFEYNNEEEIKRKIIETFQSTRRLALDREKFSLPVMIERTKNKLRDLCR